MKKRETAILLSAALLAVTLAACGTPAPAPTASAEPSPSSEPTPTPAPTPDASMAYVYENNPSLTAPDYSSEAILAPTEDAGKEYIDSMVFLCDSTLYGMKHYDVLTEPDGSKTKQIWTGNEGTLTLAYVYNTPIVYEDGTEISFVEAATKKQPKYLVITLGVNGISFMDEGGCGQKVGPRKEKSACTHMRNA